MDHLNMALTAYFTRLLAEADWPEWYQEMPEFMRGSVENWMLASFLLAIDISRTALK